jgi:hypothetical protein
MAMAAKREMSKEKARNQQYEKAGENMAKEINGNRRNK